jgi:8-oxo-dGTP pyrophosphatase MutT (NUDIX family)
VSGASFRPPNGTANAEEFDPHSVPVRPAATVMLVRDGADGLEVFMLRRTLNAAFAGGMYVFPGGRVDDADHGADLEPICDGLDDGPASARLQISRGGLAYWVAAIRECFEEAGVLLARRASESEALRFESPEVISRFGALRDRLNSGEVSFMEICVEEDLQLITDAIHYVSHWITPVGEVRRFDTRFFLARAPQAQVPLHDNSETIESLWVRPVDALERFRAGELAMIPPTIRNLEFLLPHVLADDALRAAAEVGTPPAILPKLRTDEDGRVIGIAMPDDADYSDL